MIPRPPARMIEVRRVVVRIGAARFAIRARFEPANARNRIRILNKAVLLTC